jgi:hypothetical protein
MVLECPCLRPVPIEKLTNRSIKRVLAYAGMTIYRNAHNCTLLEDPGHFWIKTTNPNDNSQLPALPHVSE